MAAKEYFFKTDQLAIWRPIGLLDISKIKEFVTFIEKNSSEKEPHFSRFIDLSQISGVSVQYEDLYPIARQRKSFYQTNIKKKVKMAFLVTNPLSYGMARMYQTLSDEPTLEVIISESREEVSKFLGVDLSIISP